MKASVPTTNPPDGFLPWVDPYGVIKSRPEQYEMIELWRPNSLSTEIVRPNRMLPQANVYGLYWRPVKAFGETEN